MIQSRLVSLLRGKCPNCEKGDTFENGNIFSLRIPKMFERCSACNVKFEKEPGFFIGAMYVSYALNIAEGVAAYILGRILYFDDPYDLRLLSMIIGIMVLLWFVNFRMARVIWMYIFMRKGNYNVERGGAPIEP